MIKIGSVPLRTARSNLSRAGFLGFEASPRLGYAFQNFSKLSSGNGRVAVATDRIGSKVLGPRSKILGPRSVAEASRSFDEASRGLANAGNLDLLGRSIF